MPHFLYLTEFDCYIIKRKNMNNIFIASFVSSQVTRQDFINYYVGISYAMKNDAQFKQLLKHSWNL